MFARVLRTLVPLAVCLSVRAEIVVFDLRGTVTSANVTRGPFAGTPNGAPVVIRFAVDSAGTGQAPNGEATYELLAWTSLVTVGSTTLRGTSSADSMRILHTASDDRLWIDALNVEAGALSCSFRREAGALFASTDPLQDLGTCAGADLGTEYFMIAGPFTYLQIAPTELVIALPHAGLVYCAGDGLPAAHTTACPCANTGAQGRGCANSVDPNGARLTAAGAPAELDVVLHADGMSATVPCVFFQGDALADALFGDGVRCAGGVLLRLSTKTNVAGASSFPDVTDGVTLAQRAGMTPGIGLTRYYQAYYRNSAPMYCPPATFNVTNGLAIDW